MSQTQIYDVFKKPVIWLLVLSDNNEKNIMNAENFTQLDQEVEKNELLENFQM